jgi:hypothetical protein
MLFETCAVTDLLFFVTREAPRKLNRGGTGDFGKDGKNHKNPFHDMTP